MEDRKILFAKAKKERRKKNKERKKSKTTNRRTAYGVVGPRGKSHERPTPSSVERKKCVSFVGLRRVLLQNNTVQGPYPV